MSQIVEAEWIWRDGELIRWRDATVHILSQAVQFGSSIFEGIRCYNTPDGPAVFRLKEHLRRLRDSCRIYRIDLAWSDEQLTEAVRTIVGRNGFSECYIRPMVLRGYGNAGMNVIGSPIETYIPCWPWGTYLGPDALENGVDACVASWQRQEPNTYPSHAKSAGHYNNGQLIKYEAILNGYAEAIALGPGGLVSEGSGQNIFLVRDGVLITPTLDGTSLEGITRDSIIRIAAEFNIPVREQPVPRETLYTADEVFFTGTAAEVTPVRSVDRIVVGNGMIGPITRQLQQRFLQRVRGEIPDDHGWLTYVNAPKASVNVIA